MTNPAGDTTSADKTMAGTPTEPPEAIESPNSEAARYRVRLREAEAERDAVAERLTGYQRRELEAAVADLLDVPGDLFDVGGADPIAFYAEDGTINQAELRAAAGALVELRPRLRSQNAAPSWGQHSAAGPPASGASWTDVINPK